MMPKYQAISGCSFVGLVLDLEQVAQLNRKFNHDCVHESLGEYLNSSLVVGGIISRFN